MRRQSAAAAALPAKVVLRCLCTATIPDVLASWRRADIVHECPGRDSAAGGCAFCQGLCACVVDSKSEINLVHVSSAISIRCRGMSMPGGTLDDSRNTSAKTFSEVAKKKA